MYPRLFLARQFLREEGVIFISIDDHEIYNLRLLMNEIYGEENFVGCIVWKNVTDNNPTNVAIEHEYLLVFAKSKCDLDSEWKSSLSDSKKKLFEIGNQLIEKYKDIKELQAAYSLWFKQNKAFLGQLDRYKYIDFGGVYTGSQSVHNPGKEGYRYDVIHPVTGKPCKQPLLGYRFPEETLKQMLHDGKILFGDDETKIIEIKVYAEEFQDKLSSLIELDGRLGAYDLREIFSEAVQIFNNPKPVKLLKSIFSYIIQPNDVVLDFFAGSCTSAQAVLELNREYGGNRHFIMVQLPEPTGNKQFPTIAEIGKERIRRVVARMKKERQGQLALDKPEDLGFKVFKLAASNYWQWEAAQPDAAAYARQAELFADPLVSGWQPENVLYEVALKEGYGLNVTFEPTAVKDVLRVSDPDKGQSFYITLAVRIALEELRPLDLKKDNLFICRDSALDDEAAANLALQCRLKTI
jgi:adenine-specific DNA-methyltransferase